MKAHVAKPNHRVEHRRAEDRETELVGVHLNRGAGKMSSGVRRPAGVLSQSRDGIHRRIPLSDIPAEWRILAVIAYLKRARDRHLQFKNIAVVIIHPSGSPEDPIVIVEHRGRSAVEKGTEMELF